jgi:hypothetical protein
VRKAHPARDRPGSRRRTGRSSATEAFGAWVIINRSSATAASPRLVRSAPAVDPVEEIPAPIAGGAPTLADQVAAEAARLRRSASPVAGFLADQLERLAQLVAFTGARTSQDFADRLEAHESALLAAEYDRGFRDGRSRSAGYCPR